VNQLSGSSDDVTKNPQAAAPDVRKVASKGRVSRTSFIRSRNGGSRERCNEVSSFMQTQSHVNHESQDSEFAVKRTSKDSSS